MRYLCQRASKKCRCHELFRYLDALLVIGQHAPVFYLFFFIIVGDLLDHTDVKSNDIVAGATLNVKVWHTWETLVEAAATNDIDWV